MNRKNLRYRICFYISLFCFSQKTFATSISYDGELERGASSSTLSFDYSFEKKEDQALQLLGLGVYIGGDSAKSENSTTNETTIVRSQNYGGSARFQVFSPVKITLSGSSSQTPETKYKESGGQIKAEYKFNKTWSVGLTAGNSTIEQKYNVTVLNRTVERDLSLEKQSTGLFVNYNYEEVFSLKISGTSYKYSKSKSDLQTAYQSQFLNNYVSNLVSSISGLPESSGSLDFTYYLSEEWDINLLFQNSKLIVDDSSSQRIEVLGTHYWEKWSLGLGLGQNRTKDSNSGSFLVSASYNF